MFVRHMYVAVYVCVFVNIYAWAYVVAKAQYGLCIASGFSLLL